MGALRLLSRFFLWLLVEFRSTKMHELFQVYVDPDGVLRCDHQISFVVITILRRHYKMTQTMAATIA